MLQAAHIDSNFGFIGLRQIGELFHPLGWWSTELVFSLELTPNSCTG